ncbi:NIPSNAP family protein [Falsiroseomonas oryzae]|uniref:NIPSNAP family protein n=1 Tax=Falsiroseomonas oryzae TaxID=2766473 RepID=UPI0022EAF745|nr:NIPSNAP family protein [Roseomonas sp. MO-31]
MIHELRIYHCLPGRLPKLLERFERHTLRIWERHGIRQAGFWTVAIGPSNHALYYLLAWQDLAERTRLWEAFRADPEWQQVMAESEKDGPILSHVENMILQPTAFSSVR